MRRFWFGKDRLEQMNHIVMNHYTIIMSVAIAFSISVVLGPVIIQNSLWAVCQQSAA